MCTRIPCLLLALTLAVAVPVGAQRAAPAPSGRAALRPQPAAASVATPPKPAVAPAVRFANLVARFEARTGNDLKLNQELCDLLRAEPGLLASVPALLRSGSVSSDASAGLILGLERAATPEAQATLATIADDPLQRHLDRLRAVVANGAISTPTNATLGHLWGLSATRADPASVDLANTALLALGVSAGNLRVTAPTRYPDVREALLVSVAASRSDNERCNALKGVGNTGDASLAGVVETWLTATAVTVRASAALALGLLRSESSRAVLLSRLREEDHGSVRTNLMFALRRLAVDVDTLDAVHALVTLEPHAVARAEMLEYLIEHKDQVAGLRETLELLMHHDPTRRNRILAAQGLYD